MWSAVWLSLLMEKHAYCYGNPKCRVKAWKNRFGSLCFSCQMLRQTYELCWFLTVLSLSPFRIFQTAWEQTHDILLLSLAQFIFKACIWLLFRSPEGRGKWLPRRRVLDQNFSPKVVSSRSYPLVGLALSLRDRSILWPAGPLVWGQKRCWLLACIHLSWGTVLIMAGHVNWGPLSGWESLLSRHSHKHYWAFAMCQTTG